MAARTLDDMAEKGYRKAKAKDDIIKERWSKAKERCIENYGKLPFGESRKRAHAAAVRAATHRTDWEKWRDNWKYAMSI